MNLAIPKSLAADVYERMKDEIFEFRLLPGDRFTETEIASRFGVSRTPVREALYRLQREGYITVSSRNGWSVKPFDFTSFENLYDVRVILEVAALRKLCDATGTPDLRALRDIWLIAAVDRIREPEIVCRLDEEFHQQLVIAAGNPEMAALHSDVSQRIRIIRRLDFTQAERIDATYEEHAQLLRSISEREFDSAQHLLTGHIEASKAVVRQITLHRLHSARAAHAA